MLKKRILGGVYILPMLIMAINTAAQNNPIFQGGTGDGTSGQGLVQSGVNIFAGGDGDGIARLSFIRNGNAIFTGSTGDGFANRNVLQSGNALFNGGTGDGWNNHNRMPVISDTIFKGSTGDGWHVLQNAAPVPDQLFKGGEGDGWASTYKPMGPIPVTMLYFNARKNGNTASLLNWKTSIEINSAYFDVERSIDAVNFHHIGTVNAAGNSQIPVEYQFTDNAPVMGMNYYRLKQVDLDGRFIYTPARLLKFDADVRGQARFYPNPTHGMLFIEMTEIMKREPKLINISNASGVVVDQFRAGVNSSSLLEVDMRRFPKAVYFIQVKTASSNNVYRVVLQ